MKGCGDCIFSGDGVDDAGEIGMICLRYDDVGRAVPREMTCVWLVTYEEYAREKDPETGIMDLDRYYLAKGLDNRPVCSSKTSRRHRISGKCRRHRR